VKVWPGQPFPLGATWDGEGTNFALFSENAERAELCLYDGNNNAWCQDNELSWFHLPTKRFGARWQFALSTAEPDVDDGARSYTARVGVPVESRSVIALRRGW